jgi:hypothetical protein
LTEEQRQEWKKAVEKAKRSADARLWSARVGHDVILAVHAELEALRARVAELEEGIAYEQEQRLQDEGEN